MTSVMAIASLATNLIRDKASAWKKDIINHNNLDEEGFKLFYAEQMVKFDKEPLALFYAVGDYYDICLFGWGPSIDLVVEVTTEDRTFIPFTYFLGNLGCWLNTDDSEKENILGHFIADMLESFDLRDVLDLSVKIKHEGGNNVAAIGLEYVGDGEYSLYVWHQNVTEKMSIESVLTFTFNEEKAPITSWGSDNNLRLNHGTKSLNLELIPGQGTKLIFNDSDEGVVFEVSVPKIPLNKEIAECYLATLRVCLALTEALDPFLIENALNSTELMSDKLNATPLYKFIGLSKEQAEILTREKLLEVSGSK